MRNNRIQIILASQQFLLRLGVKTLLSVVDVDLDIIEVDNMTEYKNTYDRIDRLCYTIISQDLNDAKSKNFAILLGQKYPASQFLLISDTEPIKSIKNISTVTFDNSQTEIIQKFQHFFNPPKVEDQDEHHTILSEREVDVLKAVALGLSNKQIADKLYISANTVVSHRKNITEKLGIKTIAGLTVYALMNELIQPDQVTS